LSNALKKYEKIYNSNYEISQDQKTIGSKVTESITESNDDNSNNTISIETSTIPIAAITSPSSPVTPTPIASSQPTFSIGDSDEDNGGFDNLALSKGNSSSKEIPPSLNTKLFVTPGVEIPHSQKSPLEEMNKLLEVEEGKVLRKAREVFEQDIEET